jgi:DNA mismatch endonuclease (patch repair protein)
MTDIVSRAKRSEIMSRIRGRDTAPELAVRSLLYRMGYRFRLHRRDLPGRPDIVLPKYQRFWREKFEANVERDRRVQRQLRKSGWKVVVIWECEIGSENKLRRTLENRLNIPVA